MTRFICYTIFLEELKKIMDVPYTKMIPTAHVQKRNQSSYC